MAARRRRSSARSKASREFVSEAEEILERMREDLSILAEGIARDLPVEPERVNQLFRAAHSLKGLSGMFGLAGASELAHHLEDVLDRLRMGRARLDREGLAVFDEALALLASMLQKLDDETSRPATEEAIAELVGRIDQWNRVPGRAGEPLEELDLPAPLLRALTEYEEHRLRENLREGRAIHVVEVDFAIQDFEEGLARIGDAVRRSGEVISTLPSPGEAPESQIRFSLLVASPRSAGELAEGLGIAEHSIRCASPGLPASQPAEEPRRETPGPAEEPVSVGRETATLKSISETVRVDIRKLDELMNLVGELALQRGSLHEIAARLVADPTTRRLGTELEKLHKGLDRKLQELQAGVLDVRMVPLRQVFDKLGRVARRLRLDLHKQVRLEIRGAETELDKLIVEELVDPLMHLVRNAFDHAIESPEQRRAAGKPPEGCVCIEAFQRGNDVVIAVSDDGRGIDTEAVRSHAIQAGLVGAEDELSHKELLDLVFRPGLSTRDQVSQTSGRGVGMDVVRSNIASLGGMVAIDSAPGRGTQIQITLPITLAIIQALLVGVGEQRFAVPLNSVRETLLVEPGEVQRSDGRELLNLRGEPLQLCRLADEFQLGEVDRRAKQYAVVLGMGEARLGLLVDRLEGQQDTVIKPIQGPVQRVRGIAGASEVGNRGAVLVLDVAALVEDATRAGAGS